MAMHIMRKPKKDRLKTIILSSLIILSVVQIGIHWNQQTQGFPFEFLLAIFPNGPVVPHVQVDQVKENYFLPKDVTVSKNSFTQWIFTQNDQYYQAIWNDVRQNYLPIILSSKPKNIFSKEYWNELLNETCTRIDFSVKYPKSMLSLFVEGGNTANQSFNGIKSIAIMPQEDVNETKNTLYVYDESMVYMYLIDIKDNSLKKEYYRSLPDTLTNQAGIYMHTSAIGQSFPDYRTEDSNIPIYVDENSTQSFQTINARIPDSIALDPASDNLDSAQESILLNQKDSLTARHLLKDNTAVFSDLDNVYKLDSRGVLQYQYLPQDKTDIGDAKTAFINAISFIELRRNLTGNVDIILSSIEKEDNYYIFGFNYMLDGINIQITDIKDNTIPATAIKIYATAKRVIECKWIIRDFTGNNDYKNYRISFTDLMDMINKKDPKLYSDLYINDNTTNKQNSELKFRNIQIGYSLDAGEDTSAPLSPSWLIETTAGNYKLRLQIEEGD